MEMNVTIIIVIIIITLIALFYVPRFMVNRAIRSVISIFRHNNAVALRDAKTIEELGLAPKHFLQRSFKTRDYKPYALQILINAGIIQTTEDGRLYLDEGQLGTSKWGNVKN